MTLEINAQAPEIKYTTVEGNETSTLTSGKETWIIFIPFAFTGVCENELCDIRDNSNTYMSETRNAVIISCDSEPTQKAWIESIGFKGSIVSDFHPHGKISKDFGVFNADLGCSNRISFLLNSEGKVEKVIAADELGKQRDLTKY